MSFDEATYDPTTSMSKDVHFPLILLIGLAIVTDSKSVIRSSLIGTNAFSMTFNPTPFPCTIFDSGTIPISKDLSDHTTVGYDLDITVSDGRNTDGPPVHTITIEDNNDIVSLNNLPVTKVVPENTAVGTSVYDVNYSGLDTSQAHSFSMMSSPTSGLTYFKIDSSSGLVSVSTSPDYEILTTMTFVFTVTVEITNVNEPPAFYLTEYIIITTEGPAGKPIGNPGFGITDPDVGDSYTLDLDCGTDTEYIAIASPSGDLRFHSDYDLDVGSLPTTVSCTVWATDVGGLTDTATLTIIIENMPWKVQNGTKL